MEQFKGIGYDICETKDTPECLYGVGGRVLSVSGCIGEQHQIDCQIVSISTTPRHFKILEKELKDSNSYALPPQARHHTCFARYYACLARYYACFDR